MKPLQSYLRCERRLTGPSSVEMERNKGDLQLMGPFLFVLIAYVHCAETDPCHVYCSIYSVCQTLLQWCLQHDSVQYFHIDIRLYKRFFFSLTTCTCQCFVKLLASKMLQVGGMPIEIDSLLALSSLQAVSKVEDVTGMHPESARLLHEDR